MKYSNVEVNGKLLEQVTFIVYLESVFACDTILL